MPAPLQLRLKKGNDGRVASFALHRRDGTFTVMRNVHAFFPVHDLTHYAVENTLHYRRGFFALVCEGWNFEDFGTPWPRGRLPDDLDPAEQIVGLFDLERATGHRITAEDVNATLDQYRRSHPGTSALPLTPRQVDTIRARVQDYTARWHALAPGETLTLDYTPGEDSGA
jgi:hypothetical protein